MTEGRFAGVWLARILNARSPLRCDCFGCKTLVTKTAGCFRPQAAAAGVWLLCLFCLFCRKVRAPCVAPLTVGGVARGPLSEARRSPTCPLSTIARPPATNIALAHESPAKPGGAFAKSVQRGQPLTEVGEHLVHATQNPKIAERSPKTVSNSAAASGRVPQGDAVARKGAPKGAARGGEATPLGTPQTSPTNLRRTALASSRTSSWVTLDPDDRRGARMMLRLGSQNLPFVPTPAEHAEAFELLAQKTVFAERAPELHAAQLAEGLPTPVRRLRACGIFPMGAHGVLTLSPTGVAGTSSVETCGRAMVCPCCGVRVREERRTHLETLLAKHLDPISPRGLPPVQRRAFFVTLTLRHQRIKHIDAFTGEITHRHPPLDTTLAMISKAWNEISKHPTFRAHHKAAGLGMVSAVEVTHGKNGWHPHLHLVLFQGVPPVARKNGQWVVNKTARPLPVWTDEQANAFRRWLTERWLQVVERTLGADFKPTVEHGVDWRECHGAGDVAGLAQYLLKDASEAAQLRMRGLSAEITRGDLKTGRLSLTHKTRPVFDLLVDAIHPSDSGRRRKARRLWWEFERSMRGFRWWRVSLGLPTALGCDEVAMAKADEAIAAEHRGVDVLAIARAHWVPLAAGGQIPRLLRRLETAGPLALFTELRDEGIECILLADCSP